MFQVADLSVSYGTNEILHNISFTLNQDDILAVIGPSGAGKTTLVKAITQLVPATGEISLDGRSLSLQQDTIAVVPQNYGLLPWKTVVQNISLAIRVRQHHKLTAAQQAAVAKLLAKLEITEISKKFPDQISGGQAQRVALARAFSLQPELLILDEAFSALDTVVKVKAQSLFVSQWQERPVTTLLITHNLEEALCLSTKILILDDGHGVVRENPLTPVPFLERPQHEQYYPLLHELQTEVAQLWQ